MLRVLHTSDWHLGRRLYGKSRYLEFQQFLQWLSDTIIEQQVDVLLIAGDIFDTSTPSNQAQNLYYDFLTNIAKTHCQHVVIIAGNHDSPSFLDAPKGLLKSLNIHVVGKIGDELADELLVLQDHTGLPQLIVMAIPYLRDKDIRQVGAGETLDDKTHKLSQGIREHYQQLAAFAMAEQTKIFAQNQRFVPIVAMGHLFVTGGQTIDGDGVRELYVGTLADVKADIFVDGIDYVALGHLHVPQMVDKQPHIRYSGSPIAMGFGEAKQQKQINLITFEVSDDQSSQTLDLFTTALSSKPTMQIHSLPVPVFQPLQSIKGDWQQIQHTLTQLKQQNTAIWLEIVYQGEDIMADLADKIRAEVKDSLLEVLKLNNHRIKQQVLQAQTIDESLEELDEIQVFERCLMAHQIPNHQQTMLWQRYRQVLDLLK